ncbi:MAG TPA: hypothetical protein ENO19_06110, partial [Halothiobacillaceae bacterium]|nr:hypothetical protein [Halothiobacillaceae bacterium]
FGVEKATLPLAGKIARATRRPIYPLIGQLDERTGRYRLRLFEPVTLPANADREAAKAVNRVIETMVRDDPAQLMWSLKYFKTAPPGEGSPREPPHECHATLAWRVVRDQRALGRYRIRAVFP